MLILLPPSEGKAVPTRGKAMDPARWNPALQEPRRQLIDALAATCREPDAIKTLGLSANQEAEVHRNLDLFDAPSAAASEIYTGVLFDALDFATLSSGAKRRAAHRLLITSSVYGLVKPTERIASYRLAGDVTLPALGKVSTFWREHLDPVVAEAAGQGLIVDLRSSTYAAFWKPSPDAKVVTVRVLHEHNGTRKVVSHFNKATKGRLVRALLEDGRDTRSIKGFADLVRDLGWFVELDGHRLDVVVTDL